MSCFPKAIRFEAPDLASESESKEPDRTGPDARGLAGRRRHPAGRRAPALREEPVYTGIHRSVGRTTRPPLDETASIRDDDDGMTEKSTLRARNFLSYKSNGSILSVCSTDSVLSIGSAGSILSVASFGSVLSVGSVASFGSVLSVGSFGSLFAVGAFGSVLAAGSIAAGAGIAVAVAVVVFLLGWATRTAAPLE
jgi:hypothetical protein